MYSPSAPDKSAYVAIRDSGLREMITAHLRALGCRLVIFDDDKAAYQAVLEAPPRLIVTDETMVDNDGIHFLVKLYANPEMHRISSIYIMPLGPYPEWSWSLASLLRGKGALCMMTLPLGRGEFEAYSQRILQWTNTSIDAESNTVVRERDA